MLRRCAWALCAVGVVGLVGCGGYGDTTDEAEAEAPRVIALGPVDGHDLPATDLERVGDGEMAPDFTAMSLAGEAITLSQFRGEKNVVLMFYRGHW